MERISQRNIYVTLITILAVVFWLLPHPGYAWDRSGVTVFATLPEGSTTPEGITAWVQDLLQESGQEDVSVTEADITVMLQEAGNALVTWVQEAITGLAQSIPQFFTNSMVVLVLMFVLLPLYKNPGKDTVTDIVPFPPEITQLFMDKSAMMITAMFKGTFVIAIVSGAAMGIVFWIAGVPYVTLLSIISAFLSLIPMVGISLLAWPVGILLILGGNVWQGVFVISTSVMTTRCSRGHNPATALRWSCCITSRPFRPRLHRPRLPGRW